MNRMAKVIDRGALTTLLGVSASLLAGCSPSSDEQWRVCTDANGRRIADAGCSNGSSGVRAHGGAGAGWRYIRSDAVPAVGDEVSGGSKSPLEGSARAAPVEGISRGGFGGFGEGGGHGGTGE